MNDTRYASRKFILTVAAFVAGCIAFTLHGISSEQWVSFTEWVLGIYMAGNVGDTAAEKLK